MTFYLLSKFLRAHSRSICRNRLSLLPYWGKDLAAPDPKPGRIFTGESLNDGFGYGLACGDVNNDGFDDVVIAASKFNPGAKQGRAYLYYGGSEK